MAANPAGFDCFRRGEPTRVMPGKVSTLGLDYFRRGEPIVGLANLGLGFTNTVPPSLSGALSVGGTLTVADGTWSPTPGSFAHYWHRADDTSGTNLVEIGATGATYTLAAADTGKYIRAGVIPSP